MRGAAATADAFTRFEQEGWDRIRAHYHRFLGRITDAAAAPLLDAAQVGAGDRVLDVATGPGYVAARAAARGATPVGVDLSPGILALARHLHPALDFRRADAQRLPLPDGAFDAVVAGFLLPHLADHARALGEFARVLRPGGAVALSTWDVPERVPMLRAITSAIAEVGPQPPPDLPAGPPFFRYAQDAAVRGLLADAGFTNVAVERVAFVREAASIEDVWAGLIDGTVRTSALVVTQPPQVQRRIRDAFARNLTPYRAGDVLRLPVSVVIASGRRRR